MVDPLAGHGHPFNDRPSCDGDPSKENAGDPDRGGGCHPYPAPGVQAVMMVVIAIPVVVVRYWCGRRDRFTRTSRRRPRWLWALGAGWCGLSTGWWGALLRRRSTGRRV